jgi:hypothetical protein
MSSTRLNELLWLAAACALLLAALGSPQFLPTEAAQDAAWEEFLKSARISAEEQMGGPDATTRPWKLSLEKGGRSRLGLWKNVDVVREDLVDTWRYEVAAYRLDRLLGLDLVPPTVERRVKGEKGSLQLWVDGTATLKKKTGDGTAVPAERAPAWNRLAFLQRAFDSLIGNEDRNANNILVTDDWRMLLIDHSRSFRTKKAFTAQLVFGERGLFRAPDGSPYPIVPLPRGFFEKLKALDEARVREAVRPYLTKSEIWAVLLRAGVLVKEIEDVARLRGEAAALY